MMGLMHILLVVLSSMLRAFVLLLALVTVAWAQDKVPAAKSVIVQPTKPTWSELSTEQHQALQPLAGEWDKMTITQKKKWLAISDKFSSLEPDLQVRLQDRMRDWIKLTPQQRQLAR